MLTIRVTAERLCARPLPYRKVRVGGEELSCFLLGLVDPAKPCKGGSQNPPRPCPVGCFMMKSIDRILVSAGRVFHVSTHPIVSSGRVGIQAERILNALDPLNRVTQMRL